jgi:hypothetical protein
MTSSHSYVQEDSWAFVTGLVPLAFATTDYITIAAGHAVDLRLKSISISRFYIKKW